MKKTIAIKDRYQIETYKIKDGLTLAMAYELDHGGKPANGGLRILPYKNVAAQQAEALVLAKHMTQKHRIYNTGFSGVKLVANGEVNSENKKLLLQAVSEVLNEHKGRIYTGCDLNINNEDMDYLNSKSPYVLNGIGSKVNTSTATAYGVYGSLKAAIDIEHSSRKSKFLIHGVGKIGSVLAKKLLADGHQVMTYDINSKNAAIDGAINISDNPKWHKIFCDFMVLCSQCGVINEKNVEHLACKWIISSANSPFSGYSTEKILKQKNIHWIPDVVSNAGAVICDSYEFTDAKNYCEADENIIYQFVQNAKYKKTIELIRMAKQYHLSPDDALKIFLTLGENKKLLEALAA